MRHAEEVTFGGSGLDRAAEWRADPDAVARARQASEARATLIWRGKPLLEAPGLDRLCRLPLSHPVVASAMETAILLGREDGAPIFAADISGWTPEGLDPSTIGGFVDPTEQVHPDIGEALRFAELRRVMTRLGSRDAELAATARALFGWHASHRFCARCGTETAMSEAGWQRLCPSCGGRHFPRTDPVVIMLVTRGERTLVGRAPFWPDGMFSCLAGYVEPGETLEAAVRREVFEEVGVRVGPVRYLASQPWPFPASLMIGMHGEALSEEIVRDPAEIAEAEWLTREDLAAAFAGTHDRIWPAREGAIARFLLRNWLADRLD
ncbi:NADH pyrophosphatase [Roseivivax jejudonensis]|uniref:NAD(+) diphosphatase n=1 Tax=Roseivivax jejudonensis TaxID=1529041 RepID=A0A1X6ZL80_9RHOB|nr:NAD(+) diphosphatase [Roseivivax jejudonensis]SLN52762.1 NADH pyrophosphatase [Roseivivax jejudonensis]